MTDEFRNPGRGSRGYTVARKMIGRRVHWWDSEAQIGESPSGTIVDITATSNGYPRYVIEWDAGAPAWWGTVIAPGSTVLVLEDS